MSNKRIGEGISVVFSAPSGSGKTTIVKQLLQRMPQLAFSVSACSRPPRYNEHPDQDYYFLSVEEFQHKIAQDAFVEWEEVYPNRYYGTLYSELERIWKEGKIVVFDVDVVGGNRLKQQLGERVLAIFVSPPSMRILEERLRNRATESEAVLRERIEKATWEMEYASKFDVQLLNDNLETACQKAQKMIEEFIEQWK